MNKTERNEDRELTIALIGASIVFGLFFAVNIWVLPLMGIQT